MQLLVPHHDLFVIPQLMITVSERSLI